MARIVVLGAGITGLAAAHRILRTRPGADVVVLEAADRIGGMIGATREHGFHVDWAANGVLTNAPDTLELVDELGLELLPSSDRARRRYIFRHGGLRAVPTSPGSFLGSPLLGPLAKLRALAEPFVPARGGAERASSSDDAEAQRWLSEVVVRADGQALGPTTDADGRITQRWAFSDDTEASIGFFG